MQFIPWIVFAACAMLAIYLVLPTRQASAPASQPSDPLDPRRVAPAALPAKSSKASARSAERPKITLRDRLVHAGIYSDKFLPMLGLIRIGLVGLMMFLGYQLSLLGVVSTRWGLFLGLLGGGIGTIAPSFLLDMLKERRQLAMRRALPDALDVIVVSLEGGLPVAASFQRVASELASAHPLLANELTIVQREVQMGRTLGQAIQSMAARFDLDDLRSMASVILQTERYGTGVTRAFRVFSDALRERRQQRAEELARKATVKLMFPTVLCIFPAMFIVILAPTVFRAVEMLKTLNTSIPGQ